MSALDSVVVAEIGSWVAAKQAMKVAQNLQREDPQNGALKTRLMQTTQTAEEAHLALKSALQRGGFTAAQLQEHLRKMTA